MNTPALTCSPRFHVAANRFPLKPLWDGLSLGRLIARRDLDWAQKRRCLNFYFDAADISNLYPTLTRSGSHWSLLGIAIAADLANGGDGEYDHGSDYWYPHGGAIYTKLDWREPAGDWDPELDSAIGSVYETKQRKNNLQPGQRPLFDPVVMHSHHPYFRLRCAHLKDMTIAVLVRNIYDSMESKYFKHQVLVRSGITPLEISTAGAQTETPSPDNDYLFPWETMLADAIAFFNSWGDVETWHPNIRVYHYDDLLADPAGVHKELTDFWGLNIPTECLTEAFRRISKEEMKKKIPQDAVARTPRIAFRTQSKTLPTERVAFIRDMLEQRLVHDFGYGHEWRKDAPSQTPATPPTTAATNP